MSNIDPDKVWELANLHRKWAEEDSGIPGMKNTHTHIAEVLESLLPTPPPRTMADIEWNDAEHSGLCATYFHGGTYRMIGSDPEDEECIICVEEDSSVSAVHESNLTPIPGTRVDLTPTSEPADPEPSMDEPATINDGSFHDSPTIEAPHPEGVPDGYWLITHPHEVDPVPAEKVADQWWIVGRGGMLPAAEIAEITLLHRLVPEVKA